MNKARVPDDRSAFVRLQPTDEVPSQNTRIRAHGRHDSGLGGSFLITVFAHIGDAQLGEQNDVRCGECLRDRNKRNLVERPASGDAGRRDALPNLLQVGRQLTTSRIRRRCGRRCHSARQINAPMRPVTLSRR